MSLAGKYDQGVKAVKGIRTMVGVVRCRCGTKYADQSGATTIELCKPLAK